MDFRICLHKWTHDVRRFRSVTTHLRFKVAPIYILTFYNTSNQQFKVSLPCVFWDAFEGYVVHRKKENNTNSYRVFLLYEFSHGSVNCAKQKRILGNEDRCTASRRNALSYAVSTDLVQKRTYHIENKQTVWPPHRVSSSAPAIYLDW